MIKLDSLLSLAICSVHMVTSLVVLCAGVGAQSGGNMLNPVMSLVPVNNTERNVNCLSA